MSFETNTDYVSLNVAEASRRDKKRFTVSRKERFKTSSQRSDDKKKQTNQRVELRKRAREEYRTLAKLAEIQQDRSARKDKGKAPQTSEQDSSAESSTAITESKKQRKKRKSKFDVGLLPELLEQARENPDFQAPSMSLEEMQEVLITGSEKRAAKRKLKEDEKEVKLLKKKEKKKRGKRNKEKEQETEGDRPSFFIDTQGAR